MNSELLYRIRQLAANDEGISGEGTRRLLAAYDEAQASREYHANCARDYLAKCAELEKRVARLEMLNCELQTRMDCESEHAANPDA